MDLQTENRIALLLMQEATKLRVEAEREGVHVYFRKPKVRSRPKSHFLTATVLGVQQANQAAKVNEMWQVRKKELKLDEKQEDRINDKHRSNKRDEDGSLKQDKRSRYGKNEGKAIISSMPIKGGNEDCYSDDDCGLRDDEVEEFLRSRVKRGRGGIGSKINETGPYLPSSSWDLGSELLDDSYLRDTEEWEQRAIGPDKPITKCRNSVTGGSLASVRRKGKEIGAMTYPSDCDGSKDKSRDIKERKKNNKERKLKDRQRHRS